MLNQYHERIISSPIYQSLLVFVLSILSLGASSQGTIQIGSGSASGGVFPINSCYGYNYSQQIYLAGEYSNGGGVAGDITGIRFYYTTGGTTTANWINDWNVYIGHTSKSAFTSNTDWEAFANLTPVYSGSIVAVENSWIEILFTAPFNYDGTSNILIAIDENAPNFSCTANWSSYTAPGNQGLLYRSDGTNPDPASPPTASTGPTNSIAQIQFIGIQADCLPPTGVSLNPTSISEISASWSGVGALSYNYELRTSGAPESGVDGLVYSGNTIENSIVFGALSTSTPYQLYIQTVCESSNSVWAGPFNSIIIEGDVCGTAIDLNTLVSPYNGTTIGANVDFSGPCNAGNSSPDLIYFIEVLANATLTIGQTANGYDSENYVGYGGSCPGATQIACFDDPDVQNVVWTNTTGETQIVYWVQDGFSGAGNAGTFTLAWSITPPPACVPPSALTVTVNSLTSATMSWNPPNPNNVSGYEYVYSTVNTPPAGSGTFTDLNSIEVSDIVPGSTYYVFVRSDCGGDLFSDWVGPVSFITIPGNVCETAIDLSTLTNPFDGTTVGATHEFSGPCNGGNTSPELFYYIEVPNGFTLSIGQTVNAYDSEVYVGYGGSCPGTTQIACFDDPDTQVVNWLNETGETQIVYWVQDGYLGAGNTGTFTLAWSLTPPPVICLIPENVSAIVTDAANQEVTISWDAPAELPAEGYEYVVTDINATPAGGGTQTSESSAVVGGNAYNTSYYVFVRSNCGDGNFSDWTLSTSFLVEPVEGCTDTQACNYNPDAVEDDGSCAYETMFYLDSDGDGYGDLNQTTDACEQPEGYVSNSTDCDDADSEKWQTADLYIDSDGDGYNNGIESVCYGAEIPEGYSLSTDGGDCNDEDNLSWQSAVLYIDIDGDGYTNGAETVCYGGEIPVGYIVESIGVDCDDNDETIWQSQTLYVDQDGDGYDNGYADICYGNTIPDGYALNSLGTDCDDNDVTQWDLVQLTVTLDLGIEDALCSNFSETADLTGGLPVGGSWSGTGVEGSTFFSEGLAAGTYTITYTVEDDGTCVIGGSATDEIEVEICSGINELSDKQISLFPSVTTGIISIRSEVNLRDAIIMDSFGKQINIITINNQGTQLYLDHLAAGVYFIKVNSDFGQKSFRVVKVD